MLALGLIATALLVVANAFFVASEFAIVKIRPTRLEQLVREGNTRAKAAQAITHRLDAYLSANQLGITLASLALGWLGEPAFARIIEPIFAGLGGMSMAAAHTTAVVIGFAIITFLHTVFGELAPKSLAIQMTEPVALWTAAPLRAFYIVMFPIIWVLNKAAALTLRVMGLKPASEAEMVHSPEELRLVLTHVPLEAGPRRLIDRVFDYTHRIARHVMTLSRDVAVLREGQSFDEVKQFVVNQQYTRYPVVDREGSRVIGYLHLKDFVSAVISGKQQSLKELVREPLYITEETPLEDLRREFQRRRVHLAIVLSADRGFAGIVTLEDLIEEVLGEIQDEQDVGEQPPLVRLPDGGFEADGRLTLDVLERELALRFTDTPEGVETLGGYLMTQLGRAARAGDTVESEDYRFTITDVRDRRVHRVKASPLPKKPEPEE